MSSEVTQLEEEVLRILNGEDVPGWCWGAAMSMCCANLKTLGYAKGLYEISEKGKAYLKERECTSTGTPAIETYT